MEITWLGHACCRIRESGVTIITDPYDETTGYTLPRLKADIVTISHDDPHHAYVKACKGNPFVIAGPGEYEIKGVFITGIATFHDKKQGSQRGPNTVYLYEFNGLSVCHLGDLGHVPTQAQIEALGHIDILLVPVGGHQCLKAAEAAEVISLLEPRIVVPIHYKTKFTTLPLAGLDVFLKEVGISMPEPLDVLKVTPANLPEETQIVVLNPRQD